MTVEEAKSAVEELKAQGMTDDDLAAALYGMFVDEKIDFDQFDALAKVIGYELTDEFKNMSDEERKGLAESDEEEENPAEGEKEEENNPFEEKPHLETPETKDDKPEESDEEKAKKLYGFNKW